MGKGFLSRRWRKDLRRRAGMLALKTFGPGLVALLGRTWKVEFLNEPLYHELRAGGGALVCMWHGRMLIGVPVFGRGGYRVLVSQSRDGDLSEELLDAFGYKVLRGSSSRGGARALRAMLEVLRAGELIVITPDGPRGPRHSMNPGLAWMARATGHPIVPLGMVADRAWHARSWDRFTVPKPRARVVIAFGEPIHVGRDVDDEQLRSLSEDLRERTMALEREAFARLGVEPDW